MKYNFDQIVPRENTESIKYDYRKAFFGEPNVLPMWVADMDFETPAFIREAIIRRARHPIYGYTFRSEAFHNSIISWMKRRHNWDIKKEWISFSPGIVPAINFAVLAYSEPGDHVLIQPPVYFPFFGAIKDHNRVLEENVLINKEGRYYIDFEDFEEKASRSKLFILCHPHNPVGRLWTDEEIEKMVKICRKYKVTMVSDEIHSDLMLNGFSHNPVLKIPGAEEITLSFYAPSKTFNLAGLSTSFLIIPNKEIKLKFDKLVDGLHLGLGNLFGAEALKAAYNEGEDWLEALKIYLNDNYRYLSEFLDGEIPEITVTPAEATYLIWLDFRKFGMDDKSLKEFIITEAGLGLNDGPSFGPGGSGFQRINIAAPRTVLSQGLEQLAEAIAKIR